MPQTNSNEAFLIATPPPVLGVWFYCFTNGTPCFLRFQFMTFFRGSVYLVLLGVGPTLLGHNLEKYESSEKLSGRPPTVKIITLLITYRQLRTQTSKNSEIRTISFWKLWNLWNLETFAKISNFFNFGLSFLLWYQTYYPKTIRKSLPLQKGVEKNYKQHINTYWN